MIKEQVQECVDIFDQYYFKYHNFYNMNDKVVLRDITYSDNIDIEFYKLSKAIIVIYDIFPDSPYFLYIRKQYDTNLITYEFCLPDDDTDIEFDINGNIIEGIKENLPNNIFDWGEEEMFYLRLKYG